MERYAHLSFYSKRRQKSFFWISRSWQEARRLIGCCWIMRLLLRISWRINASLSCSLSPLLCRWASFSCCSFVALGLVVLAASFEPETRLAMIEESQPVKKCNLSRPAKAGKNCRVNAQCLLFFHSDYRFSTGFTLLQQQAVPRICLPLNLPCLVFKPSNTFLTYTWQQTGQKHSFSFRHSSPHTQPPQWRTCVQQIVPSVFLC